MKIGFLIIFNVLFSFQVVAQQPEDIEINVNKAPLNEVLIYLKEKYGFQFAFDKDLLSQYRVTVHKKFSSKEETLEALFDKFPLAYKKSAEVFLIIPQNSFQEVRPNQVARISGQVVEARSFEPLPFSYILINNRSVQSDQQGNFTYLASADTAFNVQISHLGYFIYDTLFSGNLVKKFELTPRFAEIEEIRVEGNPIESATLVGDKPGKIKINHRIAPVLPGYGDNSVFNMLRLMPGVLAAGEQSSDLLIWGSYESHSKIQMDGFTIFGLKNYNDDIGVVNPLVLKDMEVFKGGYEAKYGDRVGGIVNITGKNGTLQKPSFTFNINNTTVNSLLEVPVSKKSSFLAAYRQTFYELYDPAEVELFSNRGSKTFDATVYPDYYFRDGNLKYTFEHENINAEVSVYGGRDKYSYFLEREYSNSLVARQEEERNQQFGGSVSVLGKDKKGNTGKVKLAFSMLANSSEEENKITNNHTHNENISREGNGENNVSQLNLSLENRWNFRNAKYVESGLGFESNNVQISRILNSASLIDMDTRLNRLFFYTQGYLPVKDFLELKAGLRGNYAIEIGKFYTDPRISATITILPELKLNAAWGFYHQFLAKTTLIDSTLNYYYFWTNSDDGTIPVLSGEHWVTSLSFNKDGFSASVEGFYKTTNGLSRYFSSSGVMESGFYSGEARSYGLDFFLKKEYKKNTAWVSYTLSKTDEHFPFYVNEYYRSAPQDQRHELKLAGVANYKSFYFSASFVYGSGFERFTFVDDNGEEYIPAYKRLDAAVIYNFKPGKVNTQIGISVLNVLNAENLKLSNIRRIATDTEDPLDINTEAVPFTPTLFLKVHF